MSSAGLLLRRQQPLRNITLFKSLASKQASPASTNYRGISWQISNRTIHHHAAASFSSILEPSQYHESDRSNRSIVPLLNGCRRRNFTATPHFQAKITMYQAPPSSDKNNQKETTPPTSNTETSADTSMLLYKKKSVLLPQVMLTLSSLHTGYWGWYVLDFLPFLSTHEIFLISPNLGFIGLGLSVMMLGGTCVYPYYTVGEMRYEQAPVNGVRVKRLTLPFCSVETEGQVWRHVRLAFDNEKWADVGHVALKMRDGGMGGEEKTILWNVKPGEVVREEVLEELLEGRSVRLERTGGKGRKRVTGDGDKEGSESKRDLKIKRKERALMRRNQYWGNRRS